MVVVVLRPADEECPVAVEPGVAGLDDPASGAPAGDADLVGDLFAAGANVRGELVVADQVADFGVVVGPVKAEALRLSPALAWGARSGSSRACPSGACGRCGWPLVVEPDRDAVRLAEDRTLRPFLALSVGFGPVFGPPSGALVIAPSAASHDQSIPTDLVVRQQPLTPDLVEHPSRTPLLKPPMRRTRRADPRSHPTRSTASPSATPTRSPPSRYDQAPSGCDNPTDETPDAGSSGSIRSHNQSGIRQPSSLLTK